MKTYSSILCQIMIGALMSIGISAQADLNFPYPDMLYKNIFCSCCLMQDESNLAKDKVHFSAAKRPDGFIEAFFSLDLKGSDKNLSINFDFDSEILGFYSADNIPAGLPFIDLNWKIYKNPKKPNNYTIINLEGNHSYCMIIFLFNAPFDVPKNVFVSEGDYPADSIGEELQASLPATMNDNSPDGPSFQGAYCRRFRLHYEYEPIEL